MRPAEIILFPLPETPDQQRALLVSLIDRLRPDQLELLSLIGRAFQPEVTEKVPDGPDAELIRQCGRVMTIMDAESAVFDVVPDGDARQAVIAQTRKKWFEARSQIFQLDGPRTLEGARAAALALLALHPGGVHATIQDADLAGWLSLRCAQYLVWETKLDDPDGNESEGRGAE